MCSGYAHTPIERNEKGGLTKNLLCSAKGLAQAGHIREPRPRRMRSERRSTYAQGRS